MHFIAGLILACLFQTAHVMETTEFPLLNSEGKIEESFAVHEMRTTTNYAPQSSLLSWYIGALNFQVEHYLFPDICHIHYKKFAPIVNEEFGIPYNVQPTFLRALMSHGRMLKALVR